MRKLRNHRRSPAQALVEFTLAATLIFFLLSAAVDLGLIFFSLQAMRTAAQEGANFGSYPEIVTSGGEVTSVDLRYNDIVDRVQNAAGDPSQGLVNLHDLNNNQVDDMTEGIIDPRNSDSFIYVENLFDTDGDPSDSTRACRTTTPRADMRNAGRFCYVRVTVRYNYNFFFPLAPAFGNTVQLRSSFIMPIRSSFIG
jgi:hypothetical protein